MEEVKLKSAKLLKLNTKKALAKEDFRHCFKWKKQMERCAAWGREQIGWERLIV